MVKIYSYFGQIKQIAMVLGLSRNQVKSLLETGEIELVMELPQSISFI